MTKISVIIPVFNAERWIEDTIQSVVEQDMEDIEVIVVDDGSTDDSAKIIERDFPHVRLFRTKNGGPGRARNIGTRLSAGSFIQYLDADDLLAPGKLRAQLNALKNSGSDIAYGDWQKIIMSKDGIFEIGERSTRRLKNPEIELLADTWFPMNSYLFSRALVEKTGGWNENLPVIQDVRFVLDCALCGGKFIHCPGLMAYYRIHSMNSVSRRDKSAFVSDCLKNTDEVNDWWVCHGGINEERKQALIRAYEYVARASFEKDRHLFESAFQKLEQLNPGYLPENPKHLRAASKLFGYKNAEKIASWYRRMLKLKIAQ